MLKLVGSYVIAKMLGFGILGALPGNDITIDNPGCVSISYPNFWSDLTRVCRPVLA